MGGGQWRGSHLSSLLTRLRKVGVEGGTERRAHRPHSENSLGTVAQSLLTCWRGCSNGPVPLHTVNPGSQGRDVDPREV